MRNKFSILVHGGAGPDSDFIRGNKEAFGKGLKKAIQAGYNILQKGGPAIDAVQEAVTKLEDDLFFNAGKGSALNNKGRVEMDASIMNGRDQKAGAVAGIERVKNPVKVARLVMEHTDQVLLGGKGALILQ